jgi:hypothetical protein
MVQTLKVFTMNQENGWLTLEVSMMKVGSGCPISKVTLTVLAHGSEIKKGTTTQKALGFQNRLILLPSKCKSEQELKLNKTARSKLKK